MVAADTMEQFQKELDQGKVSNTNKPQQLRHLTVFPHQSK